MCKNEVTRSNYVLHMASECEIRCMNLKCKYCEIYFDVRHRMVHNLLFHNKFAFYNEVVHKIHTRTTFQNIT